MTDVKEKQIWKEPAFVVGIVLTVLVLGGFAYTLFLWPMNDTYATKWAYLRNAQPNEIGDTLAGVAGTLAFVWIVVTVWLQATELREQRQEFNRMSDAQEAQAAVLEKQREIFEDEQRQRRQVENKEWLDQLLLQLRLTMTERDLQAHWVAAIPRARDLSNPDNVYQANLTLFAVDKGMTAVGGSLKTVPLPDNEADFFRYQYKNVSLLTDRLSWAIAENTLESCPSKTQADLCGVMLKEVIAKLSELSESQRVRIQNLELEALDILLRKLASLPVWNDAEEPQ